MRVVVSGGVFRLSRAEVALRQPAPESVLVSGLRARGIDVVACPLEDLATAAGRGHCDLVHIHHLSKAAVVAALSPLARPFVFTEHASGRAVGLAARAGQRLVMSRASAVVCLSQAEAEAKRAAYRLPPSRIEIILNGVAFAEDACQHRRLVPGQPIVLLFVGQLRPVKQVHRAIDALAELDERFVLRLVYHNGDLEAELRARAEGLGVAGRVTFVGQRAGAALVEEYHRAHVLLLPSESEALPSVVTEALLSGLPVVASDVGGVAGQVRGAGILVRATGDCSIAPAVSQVVADYPAFVEMGVLRAVEVADEYSIEQMVTHHLDLYRRLIGGVRP